MKLLLCLLLAASALHAETVQLKTGHWLFDRYRNVTLDEFDYTYSIYSIDYENGYLELDDGSIWQIAIMQHETISFYGQKAIAQSPLDLFAMWRPEDVLIFHKVADRSSVLVYNLNCGQLLDVLPISGPKYPKLQIVSIQNTTVLIDNYVWNDATDCYINNPKTEYYTTMVLSDGTVWQTQPSGPILTWQVGDPIHMQKDTPYCSSNTHILMNFKPIKHSSYEAPKFYRLGAWRSS